MQILAHSNICSKIGVSKNYLQLSIPMIPIIIHADNSLMQTNEKIAVHLKSSMIMMIHTWKVLHNLASKYSLYFKNWWSIQYYNSKPFNLALTSLEEVMAALFIAKTRDPS